MCVGAGKQVVFLGMHGSSNACGRAENTLMCKHTIFKKTTAHPNACNTQIITQWQ